MALEITPRNSLFLVYLGSNSVLADHTLLEGGQAQEGDHPLEEELHQDGCLLHQGTGGVGLQGDGETLLVAGA